MVCGNGKEKIGRFWGDIMQDLKITYNNGNGEMIIHMNNFFPTSQAHLKKLLKVIDLDFEHREEHIQTLGAFFKNQIESLEEKKKAAGKKYLDYMQKVADQERLVESNKRPNGLPPTKEEFKQAKEDLKHFKVVRTSCLSTTKSSARKIEQFQKHLEILEQRK